MGMGDTDPKPKQLPIDKLDLLRTVAEEVATQDLTVSEKEAELNVERAKLQSLIAKRSRAIFDGAKSLKFAEAKAMAVCYECGTYRRVQLVMDPQGNRIDTSRCPTCPPPSQS